jgi:hypothetical protein
MAYGQNMKAPMAGITGLAALKGRQGDNTLVHVNPMELKALDNMAPGGLTRNPYTGLPEAFKLKDILPALGAAAATVLTGGMAIPAFAAAGLGGAAGAALAGYNKEEILGAGLGSALTAGLMGPTGFGGKEAATQIATETAAEGAAQTGLAALPGAESVGRGLLTDAGGELAATTARELGGQTLAQAGYGAAGAMIPAALAPPEIIEEEYKGPTQSAITEMQARPNQPQAVDEFIRKGGAVPQFFDYRLTQPYIAAEGGQLGDAPRGEMFSGMVEGKGDGMSDEVAFDVVGDPEVDTAMLSPDEYVIDAHTVAALGNGSSDAGAARLDEFRKALREKVYGRKEQPNQINAEKELSKLS